MTDALTMSGVLLALVLLTQIGRHRDTLVMGLLPFVSCVGVTVAFFTGGSMVLSWPNVEAGLAGLLIGVAAGFALIATMNVERHPETSRIHTRAGWPYLFVWLSVLVGRLVFVWLLENVHSFAVGFGGFMARNGITEDGVTLFFLLMALVMIVVRASGVLVRVRRLKREPVGAGRHP